MHGGSASDQISHSLVSSHLKGDVCADLNAGEDYGLKTLDVEGGKDDVGQRFVKLGFSQSISDYLVEILSVVLGPEELLGRVDHSAEHPETDHHRKLN